MVRFPPQNRTIRFAPPPPFGNSETGRIRFRRVRFQTPNSVSFLGLTEFRGANSVSLLFVCKRELTEFLAELTEFAAELSEFSPPKQYTLETVFRPFPLCEFPTGMFSPALFLPHLSAPSPGDDLWSKSAICLRGQTIRSDSFWEIGCDFSAVTIRLRLRCILR